jgi:hypothetical protein
MSQLATQHPAAARPTAALSGERHETNHFLYAGVIGGIAAGAAMLAFLVANAAREDLHPLRPLALTAAMFAGEAAEPGPGSLVLAGLLWAVVSVGLALLYTALVPSYFPFASAAMLGVGYVFFVLVAMNSWVLPSLNPQMRDAQHDTGGAWVLAYFVFGVALGFIPAMRRRIAGASSG